MKLSLSRLSACRAVSALLNALAMLAAVPAAAQGPDAATRTARIEQLAAELRQGDPWPAIREERIERLLPAAMDSAQVDAWVVLCRENNNDPLAAHVGCESAGGLAAYLFLRTPAGVERVIVAPNNEAITLRERFPTAQFVEVRRANDVFPAIAERVRKANSRHIAVNRSELAAADGLTATHYAALTAALGSGLSKRVASSQELVIRWLGVKLPAEIEIIRRAATLTDLLEYESFDWVVPGKTTNGELYRRFRQRVEGLGMGHSWPANPGITTGLDRGRGNDMRRVIKAGDLINVDAGVTVYDTWHTDIQRFAYILRPGETAPPDSITHAWKGARRSTREMLAMMRPGVAGWQVDSVQIAVQQAEGSLKHWASTGHPVGYWAHDVGPSIGGYDAGAQRSGNSLRRLEVGMMFGYDGNFVWPAEDDGATGTKSITIEEMGLVTPTGGEYLGPPQEELVLIPTAGVKGAAPAGQESPRVAIDRAAEAISPAALRSHVRFLAQDALGGRDVSQPGFQIAAEYVAAEFERIGLEPWDGHSFLQPFDLLEGMRDLGSTLRAGVVVLRSDAVRFEPAWPTGQGRFEGDAVFAGYGLTTHGRDDYGATDVKGKAVVLLAGAPSDWSADRERARAAAAKVEVAVTRGAALVIELAAPARPSATPPQPTGERRRTMVLADGSAPRRRPDASVNAAGANRLLTAWGIDPAAARQTAGGQFSARAVGRLLLSRNHEVRRVRSWNIVGIVRGTDPARRDESVVITAHLDHVGIGQPDARGDSIFNGAHDNAIGSAQLMATAAAMARLKPARSIVFASVGAEERGLLGSWYYVKNPVLPIDRAVANINLDGGREGIATDDVFANAADLSDLERIVGEVMSSHGVGVMERDRAARDQVGFSSDHFSFLLAGVPAVDFKAGHSVKGNRDVGYQDRMRYLEEWRHRPADNFDAASFTMESTAEQAKRSLWLAWHLSQMDGMPQFKAGSLMARPRGKPERTS